ncbi:oligosaccharide flippase family protein [Pseudoalteromonas sp. B193]
MVFQAVGETIIFAKLMLFSKVINLIVLFYVKEPTDIYIALLAFSLPMLLSGVISFYFIHKKYSSKLFSLNNIFYRLRSGFDIFIGLLAPNLYNSIPTLILGAIFPIDDFTPFAVASRLSSVISTAQNVIAKSLYPVLVIIKTDQVKKLIIINSIVSLPIIVFVVFFGDEFLNLFLGSDYTNAAKYLIVFSIGLFCRSF